MHRFLISFFLMLAIDYGARAQLAAEWLRQKQTQRQYLALQIAALRQYLSVTRQGYRIVSGGIQTVEQIKRGDLDIYSVFLKSLPRVSPFIRRHRKVLNLTESYISLIEHCRHIRRHWAIIEGLPTWKRNVLIDTYLQFTNDVAQDLIFLAELITDHQFEMNDAERLAKVDQLAIRQVERRARIRQLSDDFERVAAASPRRGQEILHFKNILP